MTVINQNGYGDVESTVYAKGFEGNFELRPKTDHYCVECGPSGCFGGYIVNVNWDKNWVNVRKEETHAIGYGPAVGRTDVQIPKNKWFGLKAKCYKIENNTKVKLECWLDLQGNGNWQKTTEGTDDGTWKGAVYTADTKGSAIRVNNPAVDSQGVQLKDFTIKEF